MFRATGVLLVVGTSADVQKEWQDFKMTHGRTYNGANEEQKRFGIFKDNYDIISRTNAAKLSYTLGVNQFSDMTADEVAASYTGLKPASTWSDLPHLGTHLYSGKPLADSVDWTTNGAVTPVKNQGQCGSCWSFSTTGALEGAWKIAGNPLTSFSEQQFVDCDKVDSGCSGGLMDNGFKFAEANAICTEDSYPYKARSGACEASSCTVGLPKGDVTGYKDVSKDDEQALMEAVSQQPLSIAIEADKTAFQSYRSGILSSTCGSSLDHGVLLVGYGTENGQDYWKVKNSWGTTYGEDGYVRMLRGKGGAGECGLLSGPPSYPVVSGSKLMAPTDVQKEWQDFKLSHGKTYNGADEEQKRFGIFKDNYDFISKTNAAKLSYTLGINQFSDMTADEVATSYTGLKPASTWSDLSHLGTHQYSGKALAASVDWTTKGAVTAVKNQGQCGSCWSFSTTGALEGAWKIAGNPLTSFSEQQFVDCDKVDSGCSGGLMDNGFKFAESNAICTEDSYPYKARAGACEASSCTVGLAKGDVTGYKDVSKDDEQALMEAVSQQPVSIAIEADKMAFQSYRSGILSSTCGSSLDHGVLLVGYGTEDGQDYWKVKNSWGTTYGEDGYVRLLRGKGGAGECGLLSGPPSYPVVSASTLISV